MLGASRAWVTNKEPQQAEPRLRTLLASGKADAETEAAATLLLAHIRLDAKDLVGTERLLKDIGYRHKSSQAAPEALYLLGNCLALARRGEEATTQWNSFLEKYPNHPLVYDAWLGLSKLAEEKVRWTEAIRPLESFVSAAPAHDSVPAAWQRIGELQLRLDDREAALRSLRNAQVAAPTRNPSLNALTAELFLQLDKFDSALAQYDQALSVARTADDSAQALGGRICALSMLGKAQAFARDYALFREHFENKLEPHARIIYYDGRHLMDANDEQRARKRFAYLAEQFEETSWAAEGSYYLGAIAFRKGRFEEALTLLEAYLAKSPEARNSGDARFKQASCHYQLQHWEKAAQLYEALEADGRGGATLGFRCLWNAALAREKSADWSHAARHFASIHEKYRAAANGSSVLVSSGFDWFRAEEWTKARDTFREALRDSSSDRLPEAHYWYAKTLDRMGQVEEALDEYLKVNYLYRGAGMWGLTALYEVAQIYERSGDLERARRMYQQIVDQDGTAGTLGARALLNVKRLSAPAGAGSAKAGPAGAGVTGAAPKP
jgi:TolA-binding protein